VWYNITDAGTEVDPSVGGRTGIQVDVLTADTAIQVANKTTTKLDLEAAFGAVQGTSPDDDEVTVTNAVVGVATDAADFDTGFTISILEQGGTDYTGGADDRWTGGEFGGFVILSNGIDVPQFWDKDTGNRAKDLVGWPQADSAKVVRPFLNFIVAADLTESGVRNIYKVRWSDAAETGTIPDSWTALATNLSGTKLLQETAGGIVDMWHLGDENFIYKEDAIWRQRFIGVPSVFSWKPLTRQLGVFSKDCVRNFKDDTRSAVFGV
jgi:hypothetical protein